MLNGREVLKGQLQMGSFSTMSSFGARGPARPDDAFRTLGNGTGGEGEIRVPQNVWIQGGNPGVAQV